MKATPTRLAAAAVALALALGPAAGNAAEPLFAGFGGGARGTVDAPTRARLVETLDLTFVIPNAFIDRLLAAGAAAAVGCAFEAKNRGRAQRGVKVTVSATLTVGGFPLALGPARGRTGRDGLFVVNFPVEVAQLGSPVQVDARLDPSGGKRVTSWTGTCFGQAVRNP